MIQMKTNQLTLINQNSERETSEEILARTVLNNCYTLWGKKIASVPVQLLTIDDSYQRCTGNTISKLINEWNEEKCEFLLVSYREGKFYVIDGQHRLTAAKAKGIKELLCEILTGLTREMEARRFAQQNENICKLSPYDIFKANITCGDEMIPQVKTDILINKVCKKYHVEVKCSASSITPRVFRSLWRARRIVQNTGVDCLDWILKVISQGNWGNCGDAYSSKIIDILSSYYIEHLNNIENEEVKLTEVFKAYTPKEFETVAKYNYSDYGTVPAMKMLLKDLTK